MTIQERTSRIGPTLADIYAPYREKMSAYERTACRDMREAEKIFAEAQEIAKAFWAGAEYGRGRQ